VAQRYQKLVEEDLNIGTEAVWITAPGGGDLRSTQIGIHSVARGQLAYEDTWEPGYVGPGSLTSTTITVPDASEGDFVLVSHDKMSTGLMIVGHVSGADTVRVVVYNQTALDGFVSEGTLRAAVFPQTPAASFTMSVPVDVSIVTGTVTYDAPGGPFVWPGVSVAMTVDAVPWPGGSATANASGVYQFVGVPAGSIAVSVSGIAPAVGRRDGNNSGTTVPPTTLTLNIYAIGV
jgi:hypothetical protein